MGTDFVIATDELDMELTEAELAELDSLSSDLDRWDDELGSSDRDFIQSLFR